MGERPDWQDGEPVQSTALTPAPRDESGKMVRADWSGEEMMPVPAEQNFDEPSPYLSPDEGKQMLERAEHNNAVGMPTYAELRSDIRDALTEQQYVQVEAEVADLERHLDAGDFAQLNELVSILPGNVQALVMVALGSHAFKSFRELTTWVHDNSTPAERVMIERVWQALPDAMVRPEDFKDDDDEG